MQMNTKHSKKIRRREFAAVTLLKVFAAITILILVIIIGYILYRGIISDRTIEYNVTMRGEETLYLDENSYTVIVNDRVRTEELTAENVIDLFSGNRKDWGKISEQDLDVFPIFYNEKSEYYDEVAAFIFSEQKVDFARDTVYVDDAPSAIGRVKTTEGSVSIIPSQYAQNLPEGVKAMEIRRISMIVNSEVVALKDNIRLRYLNEQNLVDIYSGSVENWKEVGGNDTPVVLVALKGDSHLGSSFERLVMNNVSSISNDTLYVDSEEEMVMAVNNIPGAIGYGYYDKLISNEANIVNIERREVKQNLNWKFIVEPPKNSGQVGGISTIILNTIFMVLLTLIFAVPIGIAAAIYLTEYAKQGKIVQVLRFGAETLAGIPSIIFGLFGFMFFCSYLKLGIGLLSGTLTVTLMILPTIIRTAEEAIKTVPLSYREGSLALGATKWQTIKRVVLPAASPGILTGVILAIGRAIGETAAIIFTMGSDYRLAESLSSSARVLSVHLYFLVKEGISFEKAFATASILIVVILAINFTANKMISRIGKMQ